MQQAKMEALQKEITQALSHIKDLRDIHKQESKRLDDLLLKLNDMEYQARIRQVYLTVALGVVLLHSNNKDLAGILKKLLFF